MYFLSHEEHKLVTRKLLPEARRNEVHPDLRGWNWAQPPLSSPYQKTRLGIADISSQYCTSGRDLYLKKVGGAGFKSNPEMFEGLLLHRIVANAFTNAKQLLFANHQLTGLHFQKTFGLTPWETLLYAGEKDKITQAIQEKGNLLWDFEKTRIAFRIDDIRSRYPYCETDALVFLTLPVVVEQRLDGSFLGLSRNLAVDGFIHSESIVVDLKLDPKHQEFHNLATTGYAMVMESLYEFPVDLGCIVYITFKDSQIRLQREFHHISDELRQWFIEERDRKLRMIEDQIDPGKATECYETCPYKEVCTVTPA
jgi:CRISPR-associated protein Csa1